jgi:PAS domain S-box-containing protein
MTNQPSETNDSLIEPQFRLLLESLHDYAVFMIDPQGHMLTWNPGVGHVLGYAAAEFIGKDFSQIFTPEDIADHRPEQEMAVASAEGRSDDKRQHLRKDGTRFWADGVLTAVRDPQGALVAYSKVMHDVSAERDAAEALRESEERYRLLVNSIEDYAIFLLDAEGRVASWAPGAERIKGYRADEIIGQPFAVFFTAEDRQRGEPDDELRSAEIRGRYESEGWRVRKDGVRFWSNEIISAIRDASGQLRGFAKIVRDLTERQREALERERLFREAQEANRLKDEFLGTVSHELRTPLNGILGWTQILRLESNDERRARAISGIERNATALSQLVDDLLDVSRIVSGKLRLDMGPVDLHHVLTSAFEAVQPAAEAKRIQVSISVDQAAATVVADADRLRQMVWNLLSNATKFTPAGGRIDVRAHRVHGDLEVIVSDTGQGIPSDLMPVMFDRFRQADSSVSRKHGGLGLGLAIVRHLAELHGGTVSADSRGEGQGATFRIRLPVIPPASAWRADDRAEATRGAVAHPMLGGVQVLLVDDDADTREVLGSVLTQSGATVYAAGSARDALALIDQRRPDVIVADIGMPDEDGYAFIRKVRARDARDAGGTPAIALTAYARLEDRRRAVAAGYQLHVAKPVDPRTVTEAIAALIGSSTGPRP